MPGPDLRRLRRNTTADDLLDDGVENGSDRKGYANNEGRTDIASDLAMAPKRERAKHADGAGHAASAGSISVLGLGLGAVMLAAGAVLLAWPADMLVEHVRIRYLPSVIEHVTAATSRMYGAALVAAGLAVLAFALRRFR